MNFDRFCFRVPRLSAINTVRNCLMAFAVTVLFGCNHIDLDDFRQPTITDTTEPWLDDGTVRGFSAEIDVPDGFRVDRLSVRFTRHFYPGPARANLIADGTFTGQVGPSGSTSIRLQAADDFPDSHALFYQWVLEFSVAAGGGVPLTATTPVTRFVIGCTRGEIAAQLAAAMADNMTRFTSGRPTTVAFRTAMGYPLLPHRRSSIDGNGLTLSNLPLSVLAGAAAGSIGLDIWGGRPQLRRPDLLFYAPRAQRAGEALADYMDDVMAPNTTNNPYTFIGVAHTQLYDPNERPIMGCIPSDAWFVHEAGYHLDTGQMILTPPNDGAVLGSANMLARPPPPRPNGRMFWHPRLWDLHVWINPAGGPPIMSIFRPGGVPGLTMAPGVFFRPETFE